MRTENGLEWTITSFSSNHQTLIKCNRAGWRSFLPWWSTDYHRGLVVSKCIHPAVRKVLDDRDPLMQPHRLAGLLLLRGSGFSTKKYSLGENQWDIVLGWKRPCPSELTESLSDFDFISGFSDQILNESDMILKKYQSSYYATRLIKTCGGFLCYARTI